METLKVLERYFNGCLLRTGRVYYKEESFHCEDRQVVELLPVMFVQLPSLEILKTQEEKALSNLVGSCK